MTDPDDPTQAWRAGDPTDPGATPIPGDDKTQTFVPPSDDTAGQERAFVPAPVPTDATRLSPQVGPIAYEEPNYAEPYDNEPRSSSGPLIAVVVLLLLILVVGGALLFTTITREDNSPDTVPSTAETSTTQPSSTTTSTTIPPATSPSTTVPTTVPTTAPTTAPPTTPPTTTTPTSTTTSPAPPASSGN